MNYKMSFEEIYDAMMGYTDEPFIHNEFEDGFCKELYDMSFIIRLSISKQLDGNTDGENQEVLKLIDVYEKMQKFLCNKCYQYEYDEGTKEHSQV